AVLYRGPPLAAPCPIRFFDECRSAAPTRYHVKGLIAEGATSSVYGDPKTLKSTLAVDLGVHLAAGKEWRGHRVREARGVVYLAFERWRQVEKALKAYAIPDGYRDLPFAIVTRLVDMLNQGCVDVIAATVRAAEQRFGLPVGMVIFDTWSKGIAAGSGDEDRAQDQNTAAANLRRIIEALPSVHCMTIG